jgi:hypothetical protein
METPQTLLQLRVAHALLVRAATKVSRLKAMHEEEIDKLAVKIRSCTSDKQAEKLRSEWEALSERGNRITVHNVLRVAMDIGLVDMNNDDALEQIAKEGIALGRPRRIAG